MVIENGLFKVDMWERILECDKLNVDLKASNSSWKPRTVDFLWTIGYDFSS